MRRLKSNIYVIDQNSILAIRSILRLCNGVNEEFLVLSMLTSNKNAFVLVNERTRKKCSTKALLA